MATERGNAAARPMLTNDDDVGLAGLRRYRCGQARSRALLARAYASFGSQIANAMLHKSAALLSRARRAQCLPGPLVLTQPFD